MTEGHAGRSKSPHRRRLSGLDHQYDRSSGSLVWVSKTDLFQFRRCPQGFWLLKTGAVADAAAPGTAARARMDAGVEFDRVARAAEGPPAGETPRRNWLASITGAIADLRSPQVRLIYSDRTFRNAALGFKGRPDGLNTARGRMEPLEIKDHHHIAPTDELELAFYWMLLEPYRTAKRTTPVGWLQLKGDDGAPAQPLRIEIRDTALEEVRDLAGRARSALTEGMDLRWCECEVCDQYPAVSVGMRHDAPVTNIQGINKRARYLGAWGISSVGQLVATDAHQIRESLNLAAYGMSFADPGIDWENADCDDDVDDEDAYWDESSTPVLCTRNAES